MSRPWLSVIVPTYNGAKYLPYALESIAWQGADDIEVIAVDDGSTDESVPLLRRYARQIDMTIVERAHGGNWAASTNAGTRIARGDYLCWLHQDDSWRPGRLQTLRKLCRRQPAAVLFVHPCWYTRADGRRVGYWHCPLPRRERSFSPVEVVERLLIQCWIASCGTVFRADAARIAGPLNERLWYSADWDFWLRLARLGPTVYCASPLASFRLHAESQTVQAACRGNWPGTQQNVVLAEHLAYFERHFPRRPSVARIARYSASVNSELAAMMTGAMPDLLSLLRGFLALSPRGWHRYLRDSCIFERCVSRLQAGVLSVSIRLAKANTARASERAAHEEPEREKALRLAALEECGP